VESLENRTFTELGLPGDGSTIEGFVLRRCSFDACSISHTLDPDLRLTIRDGTLTGCRARRVRIGPAIIDSVTVDGLRATDPVFIWAAALRHVVLRGHLGGIVFRSEVAPIVATPKQTAAFHRANTEFYSDVDWALDITEADFIDIDLQGIPGQLIRRDPATQIVVTKERAMEGRWRSLDLGNTWFDLLLQDYANATGTGAGRGDSVVLAAPRRHRRFPDFVRAIAVLRDAGVAEPD
jgi:hypothetical protein